MDQDVAPKANAPGGPASQPDRSGQPNDADRHVEPRSDTDTDIEHAGRRPSTIDDAADHARDERITRVVHIVLGLVIAALGAWLLYRSRTELAFRGPNGEPGPGYLPVLLTICSGRAGVGCWRRSGRSAQRHATATRRPCLCTRGRWAGRCWCGCALVVCAFLIEPLGFLLAGEVFVLVIMVIERIRSIPLIVTLLLLPPAMYLLFDTLLEVQLPGGTLWY